MMHADDPVTHVFELEQEVMRLIDENLGLTEALKDVRIDIQRITRSFTSLSKLVADALAMEYRQ